jgi:hypothetical protein
MFTSSTLIVSLFLNRAMIIASPTAASAAATAMTKKTKICPLLSPKNEAKATKVKLTAFNINSIHIKIIIAFLLVRTPIIPIEKKAALNIR